MQIVTGSAGRMKGEDEEGKEKGGTLQSPKREIIGDPTIQRITRAGGRVYPSKHIHIQAA